MDRTKYIVEDTLVPHTAFASACGQIEQCFDYSEGSSEPICVAVIGESRTGKSRALEECEAKHPKSRTSEGLVVPILRVKTPSKPTVKGLAELMLSALKDPKFDSGTEYSKTIRLKTLMESAGTRMVMIDEFQHFYDKGANKVMHYVADWLKILVDDCQVALIVAGLPACRAVIDQNEQLAGRFLSPVVMPRFLWSNDEHRDEFIAILGAFQQSIGEYFDLPRLDVGGMPFRCYCGVGGLVGYLTKFLRQAVLNAVGEHKKTITIDDLNRAHNEAVWRLELISKEINPFSRKFSAEPTEELLQKICKIGTPETRLDSSSIRTSRPIGTDSVARVLSSR